MITDPSELALLYDNPNPHVNTSDTVPLEPPDQRISYTIQSIHTTSILPFQ
jgi:hypothetical protein